MFYPFKFLRPVSLDTWQTALRKQYKKRDPDLNPIGPEPVVQLPTPSPDSPTDPDDEELKAESVSTPGPSSGRTLGNTHQSNAAEADDHDLKSSHSARSATELEPDEMKFEPMNVEGSPLDVPADESKDWLSLPMLTKLDSLHLLTEWQFHNVNRIRTIMRDDDETAQWARSLPLCRSPFAHRLPCNSGLSQLATTPRPTRIGSSGVCFT